jgi:hypothetical protein
LVTVRDGRIASDVRAGTLRPVDERRPRLRVFPFEPVPIE